MDWGDNAGFINDSAVDEPQHLTNNVGVGADDKNKAIASVSVSQIAKLTRPTEGLMIHNKKIYHVNLLALVHEIIDINTQKIHILVDDYTGGGPLEVTHILGDTGIPDDDPSLSMFNDDNMEVNNDEPRGITSLKVSDYVRCIGVVKYSQDKASLVAYNMRIVDDPNEITMHTLEVIVDSMYYERIQTKGSGFAGKEEKSNMNYQGQQQTNNSDFGNLSNREKHLMKFLKDRAPDTGISVNEIAANFTAYTRPEIAESLSKLSTEGLCWQGDSEDIWCVASD